MEKPTVNLGDVVEISFTERATGYLFSADEHRVVLCSTRRFSKENLFSIPHSDITFVRNMTTEAEPKPVEKAIQGATEVIAEEFGKLIQFPGKGPDEPKAS